jgi:hypothetical protein
MKKVWFSLTIKINTIETKINSYDMFRIKMELLIVLII